MGLRRESFQVPGRIRNRALGLKAGFAVAATDQGHSAAKEPSATFARNRQELLDYGFRSLHLTAETAKMLLRTYYGDAPSKSYFDGCSQGGREGLILPNAFPPTLMASLPAHLPSTSPAAIWRAPIGCRASPKRHFPRPN